MKSTTCDHVSTFNPTMTEGFSWLITLCHRGQHGSPQQAALFVKVGRWQLQLPSLSYPQGNYFNSRTHARMSACIHQQNSEKALITPWGVDWMSYTAEDSSLPSMCLTFTRNVIMCLALDTLQYPILSLTFRKAIYNNKCRKGTMRKTNNWFNRTMHAFLLIFLYDCTLTWQASWIRWLFSLWASHWLLSTHGYSRDQPFAYGKRN